MKPINKREIEKLSTLGRLRPSLPQWLQKLKPETLVNIAENGEHNVLNIAFKDLEDLYHLGSGHYGTVKKMRHRQTGIEFAVKMISLSVTEDNEKLTDLDVHIKLGNHSPYLIKFYGALNANSYVWLLTELMDASLDMFYKQAFKLHTPLAEVLISKIAFSTLCALEYMESKEIMHRDIKPSNVLVNLQGEIKLCDFGISGFTQNSVCTAFRGCEIYMAPEKITTSNEGYSNKSDVWSLGISLIEIATGKHPFDNYALFTLLNHFNSKPSPRLDSSKFTIEFCSFVDECLIKQAKKRASIDHLLTQEFIIDHLNKPVDLIYIGTIIKNIRSN